MSFGLHSLKKIVHIKNLVKQFYYPSLFILNYLKKIKIDDLNYIRNTIKILHDNFASEIDEGTIDIVAPQAEYYPKFEEFNIKDAIFNDSLERIRWRTKQNYDIAYLMNYCYTKSEYYLQVLKAYKY